MHVTLYTKPNCSLCDQLKDDLAALHREIPLEINEINIDADLTTDTTSNTNLRHRFAYLVPVLELPNQTLHYPPHDYTSLRSALIAAAQTLDNRPSHK